MDDIEGASCLLVYREYNNTLLIVKEYPQNTEFPVTVIVDNPEDYVFAIFGKKDSDVDKSPRMTVLAPHISHKPTSGKIFFFFYRDQNVS